MQLVFDAPPRIGLAIPGALTMEVSRSIVTAVVQDVSDAALLALASSVGARLDVFPMGLEDVFVELVGAAERSGVVVPNGPARSWMTERQTEVQG